MLTLTDKLNIVCFVLLTIIAVAGIGIVIKMKLPVWKFQVIMILFIEIAGVLLLATRLIP